jgi:hypothetical protein
MKAKQADPSPHAAKRLRKENLVPPSLPSLLLLSLPVSPFLPHVPHHGRSRPHRFAYFFSAGPGWGWSTAVSAPVVLRAVRAHVAALDGLGGRGGG